MNSEYELIEVFGEKRRLLQGMSRYGYTPQTALADLIDNSLAAGATEVKIELVEQIDNSFKVFIGDNGKGMTKARLQLALGFGSPKEIQDSDLSKFGFGMKTASLEISPSGFSVLTRSRDTGKTSAASLLDEDQEGEGVPLSRFWTPEATDRTWTEFLNALVGTDGSGTVVIWEDADLKPADFFRVDIGSQEQYRKRIENRIIQYLGMVFHRWIEGTAEGNTRKARIVFDGVEVEPWNPLLPEYLDSEQVDEIPPFHVTGDDGEEVEVRLTPWVMKKGVPKPVAENLARKNNRYQGIYVYRMDRIINDPSWFTIRPNKRDPLNGLRFSLELEPRLDETCHLDVKKSTVELSNEIRTKIEPYIEQYISQEEKRAHVNRKEKNKQLTPKEALDLVAKKYGDLDKRAPTVRPERQSRTEVLTTNQEGEVRPLYLRELPLTYNSKQTVHLVPAAETGSLLWEPRTARDQTLQLLINEDHDFYQKVILPATPESYEGFLSFLIAFSRAELATQYSEFKLQFAHMRRHMSETLEFLVEDLELPNLGNVDE
jgi:hypothetical protein